MPTKNQFISCGIVTLAVMAIVFRVDMAREMITGIKAPNVDPANPKAPRALYI